MSLWRGGLWNSLQSVNGVGPWRGSLWRSEQDSTALGIKKLLFSEGQQGVFYVPQPTVFGKQVLFQDSAGTTPVTADGDPVGLMLDLHEGLVKGPEVVTNGTFDTDSDWTKDTGWTISGGVASVSLSGTSNSFLTQTVSGLNTGSYYQVTFDYSVTSGRVRANPALGYTTRTYGAGESGTASFITSPTTGSSNLAIQAIDDGTVATIDNISARELPGNHATQGTAAKKPIYRTDGTLHWLEFDGVDDRIGVVDVLGGANLADMSILAAYQTAETLGTKRMHGFGAIDIDGLSDTRHLNMAADPSLRFDGGAITSGYSQGHPTENFIRTTIKNSTSYSERFDGIEVLPPTTQSDSGIVDDFYMGHLTDACSGKIFGIFVVNEVADGKALNDSENYLANLAGVTL